MHAKIYICNYVRKTMYNPSVRQEARYEPASVIPLKTDSSILEWLRNSGRMMQRDDKEEEEKTRIVLDEDIDISGLIDDESSYDDGLDLGLDEDDFEEEL
jgi:hypothetical protein